MKFTVTIYFALITASVCFAASDTDTILSVLNDKEISRIQAAEHWTYIRIGHYSDSTYWTAGTNKMSEATLTAWLREITAPPSSILLFPDYDIATDDNLLIKTELLIWRHGIGTIRRYNPTNGTYSVKNSPSKAALELYWREFNQKENNRTQQGGPGYPSQGAGSPDP